MYNIVSVGENMIKLKDEEIRIIKSYIEDIKKIPFICGAYIEAYKLQNDYLSKYIFINALYEDSLYYKNHLAINGIVIDSMDIERRLENLKETYIDTDRIHFTLESYDSYNPMLMSNREISSERSLVSGYILFDRFGTLEQNKNHVTRYLKPNSGRDEIENIEDIFNEEKNKVIQKIFL